MKMTSLGGHDRTNSPGPTCLRKEEKEVGANSEDSKTERTKLKSSEEDAISKVSKGSSHTPGLCRNHSVCNRDNTPRKIHKVSSAPADSEIHEVSSAPADSEIHEVSLAPADSEIHEVSSAPADREIHEVTVAPADNEIREVPLAPADSEIHEVSAAPADSEIHEVTLAPADTEIHEVTLVPADSEIHEVSSASADSELQGSSRTAPRFDHEDHAYTSLRFSGEAAPPKPLIYLSDLITCPDITVITVTKQPASMTLVSMAQKVNEVNSSSPASGPRETFQVRPHGRIKAVMLHVPGAEGANQGATRRLAGGRLETLSELNENEEDLASRTDEDFQVSENRKSSPDGRKIPTPSTLQLGLESTFNLTDFQPLADDNLCLTGGQRGDIVPSLTKNPKFDDDDNKETEAVGSLGSASEVADTEGSACLNLNPAVSKENLSQKENDDVILKPSTINVRNALNDESANINCDPPDQSSVSRTDRSQERGRQQITALSDNKLTKRSSQKCWKKSDACRPTSHQMNNGGVGLNKKTTCACSPDRKPNPSRTANLQETVTNEETQKGLSSLPGAKCSLNSQGRSHKTCANSASKSGEKKDSSANTRVKRAGVCSVPPNHPTRSRNNMNQEMTQQQRQTQLPVTSAPASVRSRKTRKTRNVKRVSKQVLPDVTEHCDERDVEKACALSLERWDNYLAMSSEEMHKFECENAREHMYNEDAMEMISNRDLHVWRIIDDMVYL